MDKKAILKAAGCGCGDSCGCRDAMAESMTNIQVIAFAHMAEKKAALTQTAIKLAQAPKRSNPERDAEMKKTRDALSDMLASLNGSDSLEGFGATERSPGVFDGNPFNFGLDDFGQDPFDDKAKSRKTADALAALMLLDVILGPPPGMGARSGERSDRPMRGFTGKSDRDDPGAGDMRRGLLSF